MDWFRPYTKTKLHSGNTRRTLSIYRKLFWTRALKSHNNTENHHYPKRHKHDKHVLKLISLCLTVGTATPSFASDIGGVSATTFTQDVPGASFSLSQSFVQGDALATSAPAIGAVSAYSDQVSTAAGTAGTLAGTITTSGAMTVTGGGAGTVATGQFVNELTVN